MTDVAKIFICWAVNKLIKVSMEIIHLEKILPWNRGILCLMKNNFLDGMRNIWVSIF
jgi:hypothetical protein